MLVSYSYQQNDHLEPKKLKRQSRLEFGKGTTPLSSASPGRLSAVHRSPTLSAINPMALKLNEVRS